MTLEYKDISSKYTRVRDLLDRERLAEAKVARTKRKHGKRHGVGKAQAVVTERKRKDQAQLPTMPKYENTCWNDKKKRNACR